MTRKFRLTDFAVVIPGKFLRTTKTLPYRDMTAVEIQNTWRGATLISRSTGEASDNRKSQERLAQIAERDDLTPKTVSKWKKRSFVQDAPMGPKQPRSTVLTPEEEALIMVFHQHSRLPLDDGL